MFKRWMALILASAMVLSLAACGGKNDEETTKTNGDDVVSTEELTNEKGETEITEDEEAETSENVTEESESTEEASEETENTEESAEAEDNTTKKSDENKTTKKSDNKTTTKKNTSDKTTKKNTTEKKTTKKSENKTTTKKDNSFKIPSGKVEIVNAYKKAANRTKAQNNMKVDKTCDVDINVDKLGGKLITAIANRVAKKFMNQASGAVEKEVFKNGKPTLKTEVNSKGKFVNDKSTFIPIYGENYMCTLDPANVEYAKVTKKTGNTYSVEIKLKDDVSGINAVPKITVSGMDYFNPKLYTEDLEGLSFKNGTVYYTECVITAIIGADGYIDFVKHDMKLKAADVVVAYKAFDIDAALSGRYVTTFKFY